MGLASTIETLQLLMATTGGPRLVHMTERPPFAWLLLAALFCAAFVGCRNAPAFNWHTEHHVHPQSTTGLTIDDAPKEDEAASDVQTWPAPATILESNRVTYRPLTLMEAVHYGLANSKVLRDINGRIINAPSNVPSLYDPAIQETDPRTGEEQALSNFDAQFTTSLTFNRNERIFNNAFFGGGTRNFQQNTAEYRAEIAKRSATGTVFSMRSITNYDRNNSPNNLFFGAWDQQLEVEFRHPLLQGGGIEFNEIAPGQTRPGTYTGVRIGRVNNDIALADFETSVRNYVNDVERTYWGLYQAYRDLDSLIDGRDWTLKIWQQIQADVAVGRSRPEREALVREQYYDAQAQVENSLNGAPFQASTAQLYNPLTSLNQGLLGLERRLRYLTGMKPEELVLLKPIDDPPLVNVVFDWEESLSTALVRRPELRRQRWAIQRRELELAGSRNFLMGRLDFNGRFGERGFGDNEFGGNGNAPLNSAASGIFNQGLQQWELGLNYQTTIGNRIGYLGVRNAELNLMRERAVYKAQEEQVAYEVGGSMAEMERAYSVTRTTFNRRIAAAQNKEAIYNRFLELGERPEAGDRLGVTLEFLLDAQRRSTQAEAQFYRAAVDHTMAVAIMHYYRGTYLEYHNIQLAEGPWSAAAHASAQRESRRFVPRRFYEATTIPAPQSMGPAIQSGQLSDPPPAEGVPAPPAAQPLPEPMAVPPGPRPMINTSFAPGSELKVPATFAPYSPVSVEPTLTSPTPAGPPPASILPSGAGMPSPAFPSPAGPAAELYSPPPILAPSDPRTFRMSPPPMGPLSPPLPGQFVPTAQRIDTIAPPPQFQQRYER